jgi:hypothetical protein
MKLYDLRQQLRAAPPARTRPAVDELDEFLIAKGTMMAPPGPFKDMNGKIWTAIVDDPLARDGVRMEPMSVNDPFPMWEPTRIDASKPPTLEKMLRMGHYELRNGELRTGGRLVGKLFYSPEEDDICMVKQMLSLPRGEVMVWFGARDKTTKQEVLLKKKVWQLFLVELQDCRMCPMDRRGFTTSDCPHCNGLRMRPTRKGLAPWSAEKAARLE